MIESGNDWIESEELTMIDRNEIVDWRKRENLFVFGVELFRNVGFLVHGYTNAMIDRSIRR